MEGWIADAYADTAKSSVIVWVKGQSVRRFEFRYVPPFYVGGNRTSLTELGRRLDRMGDTAWRRTLRKAAPGMRQMDMLEITAHDLRTYRKLAEGICSMGSHGSYTVYDADIPVEQHFMLDMGIFPLAFASVTADRIECLDSPDELHYEMPPFRTLSMEVEFDERDSAGYAVRAVSIDGNVIDGGEERMLLETSRILESEACDILLTSGGDAYALRQMYRRASLLGLDGFTLGREGGLRGSYAARSYMSYGRILYKPSPALLMGRAHIDTLNSFLHSESGLAGLVEVSRLSYLGIQQLSRLSPGTAISSMESMEALRQNAAVPWKKNRAEMFKTAEELVQSDRGGLIYTPVTGFHAGVYGLDFSSLYPSIMKRENISVDTLNCPCCAGGGHRVPGLPYHFCSRRAGLIPSVIGRLIMRRRKYKGMGDEFAGRRNALKWVLVTSFGYTGYKNAKFGSIECHESINAFGREMLLRAAKRAEEMGFTVLHGIVDSLWIKGEGDAERFAAAIGDETGIPFELEGRYRWVVFLSNKGDGEGSLNKYYGLFDDGTYKLRGIELRRSDTPEVVRFAQNVMLEMLRESSDRDDFLRRARSGIGMVRDIVRNVRRGNYPPEDMVITRRVSKRLDEYSGNGEGRRALVRLREAGVEVSAGEVVKYVVAAAEKGRNIVPVQLLGAGVEYEAAHYTRLIARAVATMLLPFGYTEERVLSMLRHS